MPEDGPVALAPDKLPLEQAAALSFGGTTALAFLRRGKIQSGERVLINGASGSATCLRCCERPGVALTSRKRVIAGPVAGNAEDLRFLAELSEAGHYKPVIDRRYPFEQIADAHRLVDTGHKKGNVLIVLPAA